MSQDQQQYIRRASLIVASGRDGIDLSNMRFRFNIQQADTQSPNNCTVRVWNLSAATQQLIISNGEFTRVVIQAGYGEQFGVIFDGTIKQFGRGRENATDTYLDILAADGDIAYNFGLVSGTIAAGSTPQKRVEVIAQQMGLGYDPTRVVIPDTGGILPRGKVLWGMGRDAMRKTVSSIGSTWSVQNGNVQVLPLQGYLPGEAVVLNTMTGLIGVPVQTEEGIRIRCLLNPKLQIGGLVQIDNATINQVLQQNPAAAPIPFNQWTGIQLLAKTSADGYYRVYVVEHEGDTRDQEWYSNIVGLLVDTSSQKVLANE